jgi:signal transduction histidine kinase/CheY-like chemotaxis protein
MPFLFWVDIIIYTSATIVAFALTLMVLTSNPSNPVNILFSLYTFTAACWAFLALLIRLSLWVKVGEANFLGELASLAFLCVGPTLLLFTTNYMQIKSFINSVFVLLGFTAIAVTAVPLFEHKLVSNYYIGKSGTTHSDISDWGLAAAIVPLLFLTWSLILFIIKRKQIKEKYLFLSVLIFLLGCVVGGILDIDIPLLSFSTLISVGIMGYSVLNKQLFNPLKQRNIELHKEIKEKKRLQSQLVQAQKLEAIGRLAGGIAHDFNNVLTVIMNFSELALEELSHGSPIYDYLNEIKKAADRAATMTTQLLVFSRKHIPEPQILNLNQVIIDMEKMLKNILGENIKLKTTLSPDDCFIKIDHSQIQQVIMNLCINARDAMHKKGGTLSISTEHLSTSGKLRQEYPALTLDEYIRLTVHDTGKGIAKDILDQIFEPFFSTKEKKSSTGLGLASVHGIITHSNGAVYVQSTLGKGTAFYIYLPCEYEQKPKTPVKKKQPMPKTASRTILLVEDDDQIRASFQYVLSEQGYSVLTAENADKALALLPKHKKPIHLLITDLVMPGSMNGFDMAKKITKLFPQIKVIYMSGYIEHDDLVKDIIKSESQFLQKPITTKILLEKIQTTLKP